ncbi:GSCFA domain-containing protein [Oscillatoria amoena NRMC-F 0135]|nr:GSCFA domain-containing protein [Oscillatoria amoena NRMC-F 0135]
MMFRTTLTSHRSKHPITLKHRLLTAGSCFAESIGNKLSESKFTCATNPFGVIYNPHSIHKALRYAIHNQVPPDHTYLESQGINLNYDFHSSVGALNPAELKKNLADTIRTTHSFLKNTSWLMITYGTSWVYFRKETGDIVANCHKMPSALFQKELFTQKKLLESFESFYKDLLAFNPDIRIILTVSPVRHLNDSLELNSVSKAILRIGCHTLSEGFNRVHYFPAFELMMDDLRDYRFYKADMIHPSAEAEKYIWEYFAESYFDEPTQKFVTEWRSLLQALQHKPFHTASPAHQQFIKETLKKMESFNSLVNVDAEVEQLKKQLV